MVGDRVAVLEAERGELRQHRVVDHERRGVGAEVFERRVLRLGAMVDDGGVALAERAAARVLARDAHRRSFEQQRAERERFGERPVDLVAVERRAPRREDAGELRVRFEAVGEGRERGDDAIELLARNAGVDVRRRRLRRTGSDRCRRPCTRLGLVERLFHPRPEVLERVLGVFEREVAAIDEQLGVELADRTALPDHLVHAGLGERGLVALVVPVAPVADHVDDDVFLEHVAELEGQPDRADRRFGIVAVDVEDRRLHRLGDVGGVHRRAGETRAWS